MEINSLSFLLQIWQISVFFETVSTNSGCRFNGCYDSQRNPRPCMASPVNMAYKRNISATNTCGQPKHGFCVLGAGNHCYECDANSTALRHPAEFMVDKEFDSAYFLEEITWWQSQTWWEVNLDQTNKTNPVEVNITLSFGRGFHISGGIIVRFYTWRPKALLFEKSNDFGATWHILQYFSYNCPKFFGMPGTVGVSKEDPFAVTCTEEYSGRHPQKFGKVEFRFDSRYDGSCGYFKQHVQDFMLATNVRIRLQYPPTDGFELVFDNEETLNKYYYAIADIVITGRCNCHGHAMYCTGPRMEETCDCEHNTMGVDCGMCKPMFNNRPWMPANESHANECQECQCHSHASSCVYNGTLGHGECENCQHNTEGPSCDKCTNMYFRDSSVPMTDLNACVSCNCFSDGITNDGSCLQEAIPTAMAGQCQCKDNVFGRQCDQCSPGYWGFRLEPVGECRACGCNALGTVSNTVQCDQYIGVCPCKRTVQGRHCVECRDGFYLFPVRTGDECLQCPCDFGGAFPRCDKVSGTCYCRYGVEGTQCDRSQQGHFFPDLDFVRFEAESMTGLFTVLRPFEGYEQVFTGTGYASLLPGQYIWFLDVHILATFWYFPAVRYSIPESCQLGLGTKLVLRVESFNFNNSMEFEVHLDQLAHGLGQAWLITENIQFNASDLYHFSLTYYSTGIGDNCSVLIDSLVLFPDTYQTQVYTESSAEMHNQLLECRRSSLSQDKPAVELCEAPVFSASTEIYNGTLACNCDTTGSVTESQCSVFGGQCNCRTGVVGRTCHHCGNGFYGFSSSGCTPCGCSSAGSLSITCDVTSGNCSCKENVEGHNCDICKPGTFNLDRANTKGCLHCFGYGRAISCTSAEGFVSSIIGSQFVNISVADFNWTVVDREDTSVPFVTSESLGMVVTSVPSQSVLYILAPSWFTGAQFRSYGQRLHVKMNILGPGTGQKPPDVGGDVILKSGEMEVALSFVPSPSPNVTNYHVVLDETHVVDPQSVSPLEFQSILANLTSLKIRATYYPSPHGSVTFKELWLETAVSEPESPDGEWVDFVENATCHVNYTGLSCELCAPGFTREVVGSEPFGRCVLCSCNNRSAECDGETGSCINCQVGTYGDRCELCTNNVQGPECEQCKPGYWGLSEGGCKACDCYLPGTERGNGTVCDQVTGQCLCNATSNIGGRRCDSCKENSWNTSAGLFNCKECPPCYTSVQEEDLPIRAQISALQSQLMAIRSHPITFHNQTFMERLVQLELRAKKFIGTIGLRAIEVNNNATSHWQRFTVAFDDLSWRLNETKAITVNRTRRYTSIVAANKEETEASMTQIRDVIRTASNSLETPMRLELEHVESMSTDLGIIESQMAGLVYKAIQRENQTFLANRTIQAHREHALNTARVAADRALSAFSTQALLVSVVQALYLNASRVHLVGEETVAMVTKRLVNASAAYNESAMALSEASIPNPDRNSVLEQMIKETSNAMTLAAQYRNQTRSLFHSSVPVVVQVNAAIDRSVVLVLEVQAVLNNVTKVLSTSQATRSSAQTALSRANHVKESARGMLDVMINFEEKSQQASSLANDALTRIGLIQNVSLLIIVSVSVVNNSATDSLYIAREAMRIGAIVKDRSTEEQQVVVRAHAQALHLMNQSVVAGEVVENKTAEVTMNRDIRPVQMWCQNLTESAATAASNATTLLNRAVQANTTAQRLIALIKRVVNESSDLQGVNGDNLPALEGDLGTVREQFQTLGLGPALAELRLELESHREQLMRYKQTIQQMRLEINTRKNLLRSLTSIELC